mgnify:CR=1 FL=1
MDSSFVMPFIKSVQNVFETMLQLQVTIGQPAIKGDGQPCFDVSGIIGMSGDMEGNVVLSFPTATAERAVSLFTGVEMEKAHDDFADAVGELVNMVTGGAKAQFQGKQVDISCPSVVIGSDHVVFNSKDAVCLSIPCSCDVGDFAVEVSVRKSCLAETQDPAQSDAA